MMLNSIASITLFTPSAASAQRCTAKRRPRQGSQLVVRPPAKPRSSLTFNSIRRKLALTGLPATTPRGTTSPSESQPAHHIILRNTLPSPLLPSHQRPKGPIPANLASLSIQHPVHLTCPQLTREQIFCSAIVTAGFSYHSAPPAPSPPLPPLPTPTPPSPPSMSLAQVQHVQRLHHAHGSTGRLELSFSEQKINPIAAGEAVRSPGVGGAGGQTVRLRLPESGEWVFLRIDFLSLGGVWVEASSERGDGEGEDLAFAGDDSGAGSGGGGKETRLWTSFGSSAGLRLCVGCGGGDGLLVSVDAVERVLCTLSHERCGC